MKEIINLDNIPDNIYVELSEEDQKILWGGLNQHTVKDLAKQIEIPAINLYRYKENKSGYPLKVLKKLMNIKKLELKELLLKTQRNSEKLSTKLPILLTEDFAEFLGYLLGDGGIDFQLGVHYTTDDLQCTNKVKNLVARIFGKITYQFKDYKTHYTLYYPKILGILLNQVTKIKSGNKVDQDSAIPKDLIKSFTSKMKVKFIQAFYESDGFTDDIGIGQAGKDLESPPKVLVQIKDFLISLGFKFVSINKSSIYVTSKTKKIRRRWVLRIADKTEKKTFRKLILQEVTSTDHPE